MQDRNRVAVFIDGPNLYATTKALGVDIDFKKLHRLYQEQGLLRINYYTAILEDGEFTSLRPLIDWLDYNGFRVVTKPAKEFVDRSGIRKVKGNLDVEIAVDAMEMSPHVDRIVLFSGDGDFTCLVEALQRRGVHVTIVSTVKTTPQMVADELRRQADTFVDIADLVEKVGRSDPERPARRSRDPA